MKRKSRFTWPNLKLIFNKNQERVNSSTILVKGNLVTCLILSIASGVIDLAFFSGLSKSLLHIGTIPMSAAILYTLISIGFISAKFWCAMKLEMVKELETKLLAKGYSWAVNLKKAQIPWHIAHKFLIAISIVTALSLSVNSIGSAMKDAERNATNITVSIDELKALKDQKKSDNSDKRSLTRGNLEGVANSKQKAEEEAARYWTNIENWQNKLAQIYSSEEYLALETEAAKTAFIAKAREPYKKMAPTFVGNNIDYISHSELVTKFQQEAKKSEVDSDSIKAYEALTNENDSEIKSTILALENLYKHPNEYKDGLIIEGQTVSFLDENGEPLDVTQVIGILQGLREEWKANSDIGESSQIFMLVSELITSKVGEGNSSGSGVAETLMMVFIAIAGVVQEFLIYLFTPKAAIDRRFLRQVSHYLQWSSIEEKERFLIETYIEYKGDGVISQEQFDWKCRKCVDDMSETVDSIITKHQSKPKADHLHHRRDVNINKEGYSEAVEQALKEAEEI